MFGFGNKQKPSKPASDPDRNNDSQQSDNMSNAGEPNEAGFFTRLKNGLSRTRGKLSEGIGGLVLGEKTIDANLLDDIETQLLSADVGIEASDQIITNLKQQLDRKQLSDPDHFMQALQLELQQILEPCDVPLEIPAESRPFVILMVGVNGVGKTTTIGKLTKRLQSQGLSVMLAAGDTFRAAAVEQLQVWGERNSVPVVAQATGADSASVIFDAYQSAKAKQSDVLIADTAGRLHTKQNLMSELEKIVRVLKKQDQRLPDEILLVLDATTGQNAVNQAESFHSSTNLTGITLTKLDGTAKGGVVFAIAKRLGLPIRFIGVGEQVDDLRPFDAQQFVAALFTE
jgi:fused signal recognition particle receptor